MTDAFLPLLFFHLTTYLGDPFMSVQPDPSTFPFFNGCRIFCCINVSTLFYLPFFFNVMGHTPCDLLIPEHFSIRDVCSNSDSAFGLL